jgi:serine/threonine-protein kinase
VLAYELLAGRLPWRGAGDAMAVMASVLTDTVDLSPLDQAKVPPAVQEVVKRALSKRPEDRFASMDDLLRALEAAAKGEVPSKPPGATEAQQFSTEEVREVISKAAERGAERQGSPKLRFEDLLAIAAEVGIDPESLREASRALRARSADPPAPAAAGSAALAAPADQKGAAARRDAWLRRERRDFYRHAGVYVIINAALLVLGWVLLSFTYWWIWPIPALAWGVGLAIHALVAFTTNEEDWREHEEGVQWWKERGRRRHEERMAAIAAARGAVASVGGAIEAATGRRQQRRRVGAPPAQEDERIRVASAAHAGERPGAPSDTETGREQAAEEEAAIEEERRGERRRR